MPPTERRARTGPIHKVYLAFANSDNSEHMLQRVDDAEDDLRKIIAEMKEAGAESPLRRNIVAKEDPQAFEELRRTRDFREGTTGPVEQKTALQLIREQIEWEARMSQTPFAQTSPLVETTDVLGKPLPTPQRGKKQLKPKPRHESQTVPPYWQIHSAPSEGRVPVERQPAGTIPVVAKPEQIDDYPTDITAIHLSQEVVMTMDALQRILSRYPNLQIIQMGYSYRRLVGDDGDDTPARRLLGARGVQIIWGRVRDLPHFDQPHVNAETLSKKERYLALFDRPDKRDDLEFMFAHGFLDVQIAELYYGTQTLSEQTVADELGLNWGVVSARLQALDVWAGGQTINTAITARVQGLQRRIDRLRNALQNQAEMERYRQSFAVDNILPPVALSIDLWEQWQDVFRLYKSDPHGFDTLLGERKATMIKDLFGISRPESPQKRSQVAQQLGLTQERIRQLLNESLTQLDIIK